MHPWPSINFSSINIHAEDKNKTRFYPVWSTCKVLKNVTSNYLLRASRSIVTSPNLSTSLKIVPDVNPLYKLGNQIKPAVHLKEQGSNWWPAGCRRRAWSCRSWTTSCRTWRPRKDESGPELCAPVVGRIRRLFPGWKTVPVFRILLPRSRLIPGQLSRGGPE